MFHGKFCIAPDFLDLTIGTFMKISAHRRPLKRN
jgi:hypothetical protein